MTSSEQVESALPAVGLRERKKARTRSSIRAEAIRMFAEQGFAATTVEQIAEAADVSPSTFFRYFPTKEAVIVTDEYDALILTAFREQPAELSPIRAFRNAVRTVMSEMSAEGVEQERLRHSLLQAVPELRAAMLAQFALQLRELADVIGARAGKPGDDVGILTLAGAVMGVSLSVTLESWAGAFDTSEMASLSDRFDAAFDFLERGLPV
jgi:AcrR family transcriptional regulator